MRNAQSLPIRNSEFGISTRPPNRAVGPRASEAGLWASRFFSVVLVLVLVIVIGVSPVAAQAPVAARQAAVGSGEGAVQKIAAEQRFPESLRSFLPPLHQTIVHQQSPDIFSYISSLSALILVL